MRNMGASETARRRAAAAAAAAAAPEGKVEAAADESKEEALFTAESIELVSNLLTKNGSTISVKALLRILDTVLHMEGTIIERVHQCMRHGYAF